MSTITLQQLQQQVSELLLRHRSLLDIMSKLSQTGASVNRAVTKAVTECGCIEINACKQPFPEEPDLEAAKALLEKHITGQLCDLCSEALRAELGSQLFYLSALCNALDIGLDEVVAHESRKCATLGLFNLN